MQLSRLSCPGTELDAEVDAILGTALLGGRQTDGPISLHNAIEDAWSDSRPARTTTREEEGIDMRTTNAIVAREVTREVTRSLGIAVGEDRQLLELRIPTGPQQGQTARTRYALTRFPVEGPGETEVFDSLEGAADAWEEITGERPAAAVDLGR
jgi:hypothetical protein